MNKIDFSTYRFRASSLPNLLTNGRSKDEVLSMTTKTYLRELWIKETFGREKFVITKYMTKGITVESDSLDLLQKATNVTYFKNKKKLENEFITGTPDVIETDFILDIKSSWDLWSFAGVDQDTAYKNYFGQLLGYMWLTGKKKSQLSYCLVNTPEVQIQNELYKLTMSGIIDDTNEDQEKAKMSYLFDDIPADMRIKTYHFDFDEEVQSKLIERIGAAREYLSILSL